MIRWDDAEEKLFSSSRSTHSFVDFSLEWFPRVSKNTTKRGEVLEFTLHFVKQTFPSRLLLISYVSPLSCIFFLQNSNQATPSRCVAEAREINRMALKLNRRAPNGSVRTSSDCQQSHTKLPPEESRHRRNAQHSRWDQHIQAWIECDKGTSR